MRILVTGGAGFIGSHISEELISRGHAVRILDNFYSGDSENIEDFVDNPNLKFFKGDIRDEDLVRRAVEGVDAVFHEAAITSVPESVKNPRITRTVNVKGTKNLLEIGASEGVERLIFASSCAVYGEANYLPIGEDSELKPNSPYAESKLEAEKKCRIYEKNEDLETVILRYFNVYGPRQKGGDYAGVITKFAERLEGDKPPVIYGDGKQSRDFVYVSDVVDANLKALKKEGISGEVFNVGGGKSVSINELCDIMSEVLGKEIDPIYEEEREGDIRHSESDLSKAREGLRFTPEVSLREGIRKYINWRKTN